MAYDFTYGDGFGMGGTSVLGGSFASFLPTFDAVFKADRTLHADQMAGQMDPFNQASAMADKNASTMERTNDAQYYQRKMWIERCKLEGGRADGECERLWDQFYGNRVTGGQTPQYGQAPTVNPPSVATPATSVQGFYTQPNPLYAYVQQPVAQPTNLGYYNPSNPMNIPGY